MAAGSNSKNDLLQILVFTFFLCAIFFGAWGGYLKYKARQAKAQRDREHKSLLAMEKDFGDEKVRESVRRYLRQKEMAAQEGKTGLSRAVSNVIQNMPSRVRPNINWSRDGSKEREKGRIIELEYSCKFDATQIEYLIQFVHQLETQRPDISVTRFSVARKRPRGQDASPEPPNNWTTEAFTVSTTVAEADGR